MKPAGIHYRNHTEILQLHDWRRVPLSDFFDGARVSAAGRDLVEEAVKRFPSCPSGNLLGYSRANARDSK